MPNIAETVKKQTDRILRQRALNGSEGVVVRGVSSGPGAPAPTINNPPADLTAHKTSGDHDGRYYTEAEVNALLAAISVRHEVDFDSEDPWTVTHNLGYLPNVTVWERLSEGLFFGSQNFGTSPFGGRNEGYQVADSELAVVTQTGVNELVVTWGSSKSGKVVYI